MSFPFYSIFFPTVMVGGIELLLPNVIPTGMYLNIMYNCTCLENCAWRKHKREQEKTEEGLDGRFAYRGARASTRVRVVAQ